MRRLSLLLAPLPFLAACGPTEETTEQTAPREVPIVAPDGVLGPVHCEDGRLEERWDYQWDGPRLVAATRTRAAVDLQTTVTWADGRLMGWTGEGQDASTVTFTRDAAGDITGWTRTDPTRAPLEVTVAPIEGGVELHLRGELYVTPWTMDHEVFDLNALPDVARALPSMALLIEALVGVHLGDDPGLELALGQADLRERRTVDAQGRLTAVTFDLDGDGADDVVQTHAYADGQVVITLDLDGDGAPERTTTRTLDDEGRPVREVVAGGAHTSWLYEPGLLKTLRDDDGDDAPNAVTWLYLNAAGQRVLKYEDYDANGQAEWRRRYGYGADGQRVLAERDNNGDGIIDHRFEVAHGPDGSVVSTFERVPDPNGCGGRW
ncbi:MAG: hypothetical protein H6702_19645 [Myxococcales bacterium]|nr:hypothetical protein [Myxococcales bacterium]